MKYVPWVVSLVLAVYITVTLMIPRVDALNEAVTSSPAIQPTWTPVVIERVVEVVVTVTPTELPISTATPIALEEALIPTNVPDAPTPVPTPTAQLVTATLQSANIRTGPGTNYDIAGGLPAGATLDIVGRNAAGDWYQLSSGTWIFGQLVNNAPMSVAIIEAIAPPPPPTLAPTQVPVVAEPAPVVEEPAPAQSSGGLVGTIHVDSWRFEITEVRVDPGLDVNRKSIVFLGWLHNHGTQMDTFTAGYRMVLQDSQGRLYREERKVTWAARDKYGADSGASINPEARRHTAFGYDVPADIPPIKWKVN